MSFITSPGVIVPPLTAGGVAYGTGNQAFVNNAGTVGQVLVSGGAGVPTFSSVGTVAVTSFSGANTGLTPSTATTGAVSLGGTLTVGSGGTSLTTLTANNVILGNGALAPTFVAPGTSGNVLLSNGSTWTSSTPATLPVNKGGTSLTSLTANSVMLGNGTSTPQFVSPGASGEVLTSNGSVWVSAAAAGGLVFLSSVTASSSATVDIESTFNSTFDAYLIVVTGLVPANDNSSILIRMKLGGSYETSGYSNRISFLRDNESTYQGSGSQSINGITLSLGAGNGASRSGNAEIRVYRPTSTTQRKMIRFDAVQIGESGTTTHNLGVGSHTTNTSALTGIRFLVDAGNIATGTFRLYGIANS